MSLKLRQILVYYSTYFCSSLSLDPTYRSFDGCGSNPCVNGGVCTDMFMGYTCDCKTAFRGTHCEIGVAPRSINACYSEPCANGGTCVARDNRFSCFCTPEYIEYTFDWCVSPADVDDCASNPCYNGGTCQDQRDSYTCECPRGASGTHCQTVPRVTIMGYVGPIEEGLTLNLFCALTGYVEEAITPSYLWSFSRKGSLKVLEISFSKSYSKLKVSQNDAGLYACSVQTMVKKLSASITVDVKPPAVGGGDPSSGGADGDPSSGGADGGPSSGALQGDQINTIAGASVGVVGFLFMIVSVFVLVKYGILTLPKLKQAPQALVP